MNKEFFQHKISQHTLCLTEGILTIEEIGHISTGRILSNIYSQIAFNMDDYYFVCYNPHIEIYALSSPDLDKLLEEVIDNLWSCYCKGELWNISYVGSVHSGI